jgi:AraC-like DNA-binding protein
MLMKNIFKHFLLIASISAICLSFICCKPDKSSVDSSVSWEKSKPRSAEHAQLLNLYTPKIIRYYSSDPDSAIVYYKKIIDIYNSESMFYDQFQAYIQLSELYSFRKSDGVNAVYYYGEALKLMMKYNGNEDMAPYFHIDMGNMFYTNRLYDQAKNCYVKAIRVSLRQNNDFAISVALNNIGIIYRQTGKYDLARTFFRQALGLRYKIAPIYVAQNHMYLAQTFGLQHRNDSMINHRNKALLELDRQFAGRIDSSVITPSAARALAKDIHVYDAVMMGNYYREKGEYFHTLSCLDRATSLSFEVRDHNTAISCLFQSAGLLDTMGETRTAVAKAEQAYTEALHHHQFEYVAKSSKLLIAFYNKLKNREKSDYYVTQAIAYTDSMQEDEMSERQQISKMLLITSHTEDSLRYYQSKEAHDRTVMMAQSLFIAGLTLALILLGILLLVIARNRKKLKVEHLAMMEHILHRIREDEMKEELRKQGENNSPNPLFDDHLHRLLKVEKIFTQKNLALADLATLLETNVTYLSQYFNNTMDTNFNDYINSHRVEEACRIFKDNTNLKYSIDQVADMVGFSSRTTFYSTFKKFTGITPAFFQKNCLYINN